LLFSLFGRKEKAEPRRIGDGMPMRVPDTLRGPNTAANLELQRELARRTAEKIDQIESEMIDADLQGGSSAPVTNPAPVTLPMPARRGAPAQAPRTVFDASWGDAAGPKDPVGDAGAAAMPDGRTPAAPLPPLEFSTSVLLGDTMAGVGGIQVSVSALPPELEEAAILFANAQPQAAAATLRAALNSGMLGERTRQGWLMLLDVLQAMGERAQFDAVAIDYASRFEQSPPAWQEAAAEQSAPRPVVVPASVRFGARLDEACVRQVEQIRRAAASGKPVTIDLSSVAEFDHDGAMLLCGLLDQFAASGGELVVQGAARLHEVARAAIEAGRRDPADGGWKLALAALRLLGEKDAFDDLSIDYCVTYEVSPPSWEPMPPNVRVPSPGAETSTRVRAAAPAGNTTRLRTAMIGEGGAFTLRGEIAGRMAGELAALRAYASDRSDLVVDCRTLRRLDFVAAGELLNEVVLLVGQGHSVLFAQPSAIVEALFVVMGIHEVADIQKRRV